MGLWNTLVTSLVKPEDDFRQRLRKSIMGALFLVSPLLEVAQLTVPNNFETLPLFKFAFSDLPSTCCHSQSDMEKFGEFFQYWGHAVINSVKVGGTVKAHTWVDKCVVEERPLSWIEDQCALEVARRWFSGSGGDVDNSSGSTDSEHHLDPEFSNASDSTIAMSGGDPVTADSLLMNLSINGGDSSSDWAEWINTIPDEPSAISLTVKPISEFITDPLKRESTRLAILQILMQAEGALRIREAALAANQSSNTTKNNSHTPALCATKRRTSSSSGGAGASGTPVWIFLLTGGCSAVVLSNIAVAYLRRRYDDNEDHDAKRREGGGFLSSRDGEEAKRERSELLAKINDQEVRIGDLTGKYAYERAKNEAMDGITIPDQQVDHVPTASGRSGTTLTTTSSRSSSIEGSTTNPPTVSTTPAGRVAPFMSRK